MAPLEDFSSLRKVLVIYLALIFFTSSMFISANTVEVEPQKYEFFGRRTLLEVEKADKPIKKKANTTTTTATLSSKNQTKLAKTINVPSKNQTKVIKTSTSSAKNQTKITKLLSESLKNKTKLIKPSSDSATKEKPTIKPLLKKLNSTSKSSTSAKNSTLLPKKSSDLLSKTISTRNKTAKTTTTKETKLLIDKNLSSESKFTSNSNSKLKSKSTDNDQSSDKKPKSEKAHKQTLPSWIDREDDEDDLVSGFRDLSSKLQETLLPDLERISKTSKVYLNKANKQITRGFKPIVGSKYAPTIACIVSVASILIPLILVSLIFNRIKAYFSLQKILIFIQVYLSIYFSILCLSSLATGLEPLRFFYSTSQSTYICLQVMQTLAYVLYLLLLLMYLILVFSTETGLVTKLLGLGQTFVGFSIGLHYYMAVFHRAVLNQPPKTSWRVHAIYATFFLAICLLSRADRRKKAYSGGDEGKMS